MPLASHARTVRGVAISVLVLAAVAAGGCITGVPHCCAIIVPARYDVGAIAPSDGRRAGVHLALGASWASGAPDPATPVDVSLGYILDFRGNTTPSLDRTAAPPAAPAPRPEQLGSTTFGGYLELAHRIAGSRRQRGYLGLRAEILQNDPEGAKRYGFGITARGSWEVMHAGRGPSWSGALAAGVFVEATTRRFSDLIETAVVTGISFRVPMKFLPMHHHSSE